MASAVERHLPSPSILTAEQQTGDLETYKSEVLHLEPDEITERANDHGANRCTRLAQHPHDDPDASLAFYRDTLGFEVRNDVAYGAMR